MINIFENDTIYASAYVQVGTARPLNASELSHLNTLKPGEVFQGQYSLACRFYVKGSDHAYFCKSLDTTSVATEGMVFDITKCLVTQWKKPDSSEIKVKILVTADALL